MERRLLPDVRLGNVSLQVAFPRGTGAMDGNVFTSELETLVSQSGSGIRLVNQKPEYEVRCYTTAYQAPIITSKTENSSKLFGKGAQPVTNREAHGNATLDARLVRVSDGAVATAFSESVALNASTVGNAGNINLFHIGGFGRSQSQDQGPASVTEPLADSDTNATLTARMLKTLALRVASHLTLMDERVTVLLAQGGPLDEAARLATNARWSEYLEKLSTVTPPSDPADNAYLLYDLGVANEALGYAAGDPKATLKYLQESSIDYSRAAEGKPAEKYFLTPQKRIETAITRYTKLANGVTSTSASETTETAAPPQVRKSSGEKLTNADVVKLVKAHLDPRLIANKINTAPEADFDLSVDGLVSLSKSGVPSDLIAAMTNRMQRQDGGGSAH